MKVGLALNYLGQLRLYSLVDLLLMLYAGGYTNASMLGPVLIWVGFLAYLEARHKDDNRAIVPIWVAAIFGLISLFLFGLLKGLLFAIFSYCYTKKKYRYWGLASPFFRGLQVLVLLGFSHFALLAAFATMVRNVLGDFRDVEQDRIEGLKTYPVILGVKNGWLFLHLFATLTTSYFWWQETGIDALWLLCAYFVQVRTYWLTPRGSNELAVNKLVSFWRHLL